MDGPDLDAWLPAPAVGVSHRAGAATDLERAWQAAQQVRLSDTRLLGRLIRWRIPGVGADVRFAELLCSPPFQVLEEHEHCLLCGLVGRIWTLRRDYPQLHDPEEFRGWHQPGTARVLFANWVEPGPDAAAVLRSETRVEAFGVQGRVGLASVRPLIRGFQHLVATDAMAAVLRALRDG